MRKPLTFLVSLLMSFLLTGQAFAQCACSPSPDGAAQSATGAHNSHHEMEYGEPDTHHHSPSLPGPENRNQCELACDTIISCANTQTQTQSTALQNSPKPEFSAVIVATNPPANNLFFLDKAVFPDSVPPPPIATSLFAQHTLLLN